MQGPRTSSSLRPDVICSALTNSKQFYRIDQKIVELSKCLNCQKVQIVDGIKNNPITESCCLPIVYQNVLLSLPGDFQGVDEHFYIELPLESNV